MSIQISQSTAFDPEEGLDPDSIRRTIGAQITRLERISESEGVALNWDTFNITTKPGAHSGAGRVLVTRVRTLD